jgi:hypothetical protein
MIKIPNSALGYSVINRGIVMGADSITVKHWAVNPEMR